MDQFNWSQWHQLLNLSAKTYVCGYCGTNVGSTHGYYSNQDVSNIRMYICTNCGCPTFFNGHSGTQTPGPMIGKDVKKLPEDVNALYKEIRESIKSGCNTSAVLAARKLIMHLAVNVAGAKEGETFVAYVDHLKDSHYIPPKSDKWLDKIRTDSNETNHELKLATADEAISHQKFIELLLSFMFEYADEDETTT